MLQSVGYIQYVLVELLNLDSLKEGDGIESALRHHSACWHKSRTDAS